MTNEHRLSDDPEKNLELENDILKLKLSAEYGMSFGQAQSEELTPALEHVFLKNVEEFEKQYAKDIRCTLYENLGKPEIIPASELDVAGLSREINRLLNLMRENCVHLDFLDGPYSYELVYRFITEEFMQKEITVIKAKNFFQGFIYEEYYPNHEADIKKCIKECIDDLMKREINEYSRWVPQEFTWADGSKLSRDEFIKKMDQAFSAFSELEFYYYNLDLLWHEPVDDENDVESRAMVEGEIKYAAVLKNGDQELYEGRMKMSLKRKWQSWDVVAFEVPGMGL